MEIGIDLAWNAEPDSVTFYKSDINPYASSQPGG